MMKIGYIDIRKQGGEKQMNQKDLKREFKKHRKIEKTRSYRYNVFGSGLVVFALLLCVIAISVFTSFTSANLYPLPILIYAGIGIMAVIGATLDIAGEIIFKKEFEEYIKRQNEEGRKG